MKDLMYFNDGLNYMSEILILTLDFKPVFHSIISSPPAENYDSKIRFSHSFVAEEISSGPPVVENFLLLLHLLFMEPKNK